MDSWSGKQAGRSCLGMLVGRSAGSGRMRDGPVMAVRRRRALAAAAAVCLQLEAPLAGAQANRFEPAPATQPSFESIETCLPIRGAIGEQLAYLRLAGAPLSAPDQAAQHAFFYRITAGGAQAPSGTAMSSANPFMRLLTGAPPPLVKLLVDGSVDVSAGRSAQGERSLAECVRQAATAKDSLLEASCANNLALAHAAQGRMEQARVQLERALRLYEEPRKPPVDASVPPHIQAVLDRHKEQLERLPPGIRAQIEPKTRGMQAEVSEKMKQANEQAWRAQESIDIKRGVERAKLNLGNLAWASGRLAEAEARFVEARAVASGAIAGCDAASTMDLARLQHRLGRDGVRPPSLRPRDSSEAGSDISLTEYGTVRLALSGAEQTAAIDPSARRPGAGANRASAPAMEIPLTFGETAARFDDTVLSRLLAEASRETAEQAPSPGVAWRRLALRSAAGERPDLEFKARAALMSLHARKGETAAAIFHGKRAANLAQSVRASLNDKSPSREARRAFLRERRDVYAALAQLLLDAQRLEEAETVLRLLKEDEGQQFIDDRPGAQLGRLFASAAEEAIRQRDDSASQQLRQAEQARVDAVRTLPVGANALLMTNQSQLESMRLRLGLMLPALAGRLKEEPLRFAASDPRAQAMARDYQDFFGGPGARVDLFLRHLIDDAPAFDTPVSASDRAQLADIQQRLARIKADVVPLTKNILVSDAQAFSVTMRAPGQRARSEESNAYDFLAAEASERMWRGIRQADAIEARHVQRDVEADLRATASPSNAGSTNKSDDTTALIATQPQATALLYYLPGDSRLDALLVTKAGRKHVRIDMSADALNAEIDAFVTVLRQPERDPRAAATALYRRVFAPIEQAVEQSGAKILALSLAGKLRFVPFAALHDTRGWLVERYALATHPGGELTGRLAPASANWRVAAFAASAGSGEFAPLPGVRAEVSSIVRRRDADGGVLPGDAWVDREFTAERLRTALRSGAQALHIASHFKFVGGDSNGSYLLLGDGSTLSLRELSGPNYRLDRTELVTLSACSTGLSADDAYGQEVDGLAALLMGQGASAVLASMWEVNDRSTAMLMASMYRLRESERLTRALALQQAQLAMIRSAGDAASRPARRGGSTDRGASRIPLPGDPEEPDNTSTFERAINFGQSHPFHWAAFVLMGNWQ